MKYCLLGEKLGHSYSKEIHAYCGLDYVLKEVTPCMVADFAFSNEFSGYNVTIPYKKTIMPYLDFISEDAKAVGAVNTVVIKGGKKHGHNTDVCGFIYSVKRIGVSLSGKKVMILGTGGAHNAVKRACEIEKAKEIISVGRNSKINYENCYDITGVDVIVNATPVGMYPNVFDSPIDLSRFKSLTAVVDLIYNPQKTKLLLQAEELGIKNTNGLSMLVEQALCSQDLWLGKTHDYSLTEEIISKISNDKRNVCLVGMPSSGKSTIGKLLAEKLSKEFIDLDIEIEKTVGKTPSEIINERGEKAFREIETAVLKEVAINSSKVIATGGGAIISKENREVIKQNSISVYIKRDLSLLSVNGRPLSIAKGVETLYNERKDFYNLSDITVQNNGDINECLKEILNKL